MNVDFITRFRK